jgi:hypothetical protein
MEGGPVTPQLRQRLVAACGYAEHKFDGTFRFCRPQQLLTHRLDKMRQIEVSTTESFLGLITVATREHRKADATRLRVRLCQWLGVTPGPDLPPLPPTLET